MADDARLFLFGTGNFEGKAGDQQAGLIRAKTPLGAREALCLIRSEAAGRAGVEKLSFGFLEDVSSLERAAILLHNRGPRVELRAYTMIGNVRKGRIYEEDEKLLNDFKLVMGLPADNPPSPAFATDRGGWAKSVRY